MGKVVIVTGASSGIGEEIAYRYASRKYCLVLAARSAENLAKVSKKCIELGAEVIIVPTDVTVQAECENLIKACINRFDRLDILVLNAGVSSHFPFTSKADITVYQRLMEVNFYGYLYCTKYAWDHLKGHGQILVVSSMSGEVGLPLRSAYCASKFAVNGFFDALQMEQNKSLDRVDITIVCPSSVASDMRRNAIPPGESSTPATKTTESRMSVSMCVDQIIHSADRRLPRRRIPFKSSVAVVLRSLFPGLIDPFLIRASRL